ncbi:MAG: tRNA 5-methoxyuridine(34)/uridine 5-oxyacetic acid(34) synthase CmoB [Pseudomonadota bacterium]
MLHYFDDFYAHIEKTHLAPFLPQFENAINISFEAFQKHGDWDEWMACYEQLPSLTASDIDLSTDQLLIGAHDDISNTQRAQLKEQLLKLHPWRKGPYSLFGIDIDCEWRSDWKWQRLAPHISDLRDKYVLDVGCGSGYHSLRMSATGARCVIGIDPAAKFFIQYLSLKKYHAHASNNMHFLPLRAEEMPPKMECFDSVFSMGVLYHRKSPFDHLDQLTQFLKPGGELILETLVVDGPKHTVLVPTDRYACMRNVWFLPSCDTLEDWLHKGGWKGIRVVDVNTTRLDEQRSTEWMHFRSLRDFLDPQSHDLTIEGYPAPKRAILIAKK